MKITYLLLIFLCFSLVSLAQTKVTKTIEPFMDALPVVYQDNVKGGFHQVADANALNAMSVNIKNVGMLVVLEDSHATYQWDGTVWRQVQLVRNWESGAGYFTGDLFLYNNTMVIAQTDGTIGESDNPLTDAVNWTSMLGGNLGEGQLLVGNLEGVAQAVSLSGDATLDADGKITVNSVALSGDASVDTEGAITVEKIQNVDVAASAPVAEQVLQYDGSAWGPATIETTDEKVKVGALGTAKILSDTDFDGATTDITIKDGAVTSAKILDGEVQTADIADGNVTLPKIANGLANEVLKTNAAGDATEWGTLSADNITGSALTSTDLNISTDGATALLKDVTIDINADAVTNAKVADDAIQTENILDGEVQTADIADGNVTLPKIANGLANEVLKTNATGNATEWGALTADNITGSALNSSDLSISGDPTTALLTELTIDINDGVITSTKITDGTIMAVDFSDMGAADGQILKYNGTEWDVADDITLADGTTESSTLRWNNTSSAWEESQVLMNDGTDVAISGDLSVEGGDLNTTVTTATLFNAGVTTLSIGGESTATTLGASDGTATTTVQNNLIVGSPAVDKITMDGSDLMVGGDAEFDGTVWVQGTLNTPSDERLKTHIETLTSVLEKIEQLRGVQYLYKDQQKYASGEQIGVIAQELQKVFPELVSTGADGYLAVNYSQLTAVLLQAVKEQQQEIDLLKKQMQIVMHKLKLE